MSGSPCVITVWGMRSKGPPVVLEYRRQLAVQRVLEGYSVEQVSKFLGVTPRSIRRWLAAFHAGGSQALVARPVPGRPPKLTRTQEKVVQRWLADNPSMYNFPTELWTCQRLATLIRQEFGVSFHPGYLATWLRQRGFTPQFPKRTPRERDPERIARWLAKDWPRIKKKRGVGEPTSPS